MQCIALPLDWLSGCGGLPFACCRIWLCLAAICRWQGAKAHSQCPETIVLHVVRVTPILLAAFKARSAELLFSLLRLLLGIGSAIICLVFGRRGRRRLPPVESAGNDIVRELMGIA